MKQAVDNTISAKCKAVISSYLISYASCIIREKQVSIPFIFSVYLAPKFIFFRADILMLHFTMFEMHCED